MTAVAPAQSTYAQIEQKVRYLTASASPQTLSSAAIQQYVNDVYCSDFAYGIKVDQMRSVYTFYTQPYIDRYPLDVQYNQGVRAPIYVDGIQGFFYKDRDEFYRLWPRWPTKFQGSQTSPQGQISAITQAANAQVTAPNHGLTTGNTVFINNVQGMIQVNNITFEIAVVDANNFTLGVNSTLYGAYTGGGTWYQTPVVFSTLIQGPFLSTQVSIGGVDALGNPITVIDDGDGNLWNQTPNPVVSVPAYGSNYQPPSPSAGMPIPGMYNQNLYNPGLNKQVEVGTVNYVTGNISFTNPIPLQGGTTLTIWVSQYETGRPYCLLFWNNYFQIRPIPKLVHRVEVETYLTPVQFMMTTDSPILTQWWKYLALLASRQILMDRQDMEGVENINMELKRQEGLVLERQATEEINSRNNTIFAGSQQNSGWNSGFQQGWY